MSRRAAWARRGIRAGLMLDTLATRGPLSGPDALAVLAVAIRGRITPAGLSDVSGVTLTTARDRLRQLAEAGWIRRETYVEGECYAPLLELERVAADTVGAAT